MSRNITLNSKCFIAYITGIRFFTYKVKFSKLKKKVKKKKKNRTSNSNNNIEKNIFSNHKRIRNLESESSEDGKNKQKTMILL